MGKIGRRFIVCFFSVLYPTIFLLLLLFFSTFVCSGKNFYFYARKEIGKVLLSTDELCRLMCKVANDSRLTEVRHFFDKTTRVDRQK